MQVLSDTQVMVHVPQEIMLAKSRTRGNAAPPTKYTFSHVFAAQDAESVNRAQAQAELFRTTTLPLVRDVLAGKNSLVFTYGVTNSGKTYTIQGAPRRGEAGILPRAIDVIFHSIAGHECTRAVRPKALTGVQFGVSDPSQSLLASRSRTRGKVGARVDAAAPVTDVLDVDSTKVDVDARYRYSVWVSYVEVYNEKLYDLLESPTQSLLVRPTEEHAALDTDTHSAAPTRRPLLLKSEAESGGKYVSGLKEIKVTSIQEARELIRCGQENRTVFGTVLNRSSSRSHSVFTIKILREDTGVDVDPRDAAGLSSKYAVSRLTIVDLAGSERISNTDISAGPRLKEAGSINKSLMCLGQCLETIRKNQLRAGISGLPSDKPLAMPRAGDEPRKRRQSIVPFRHSKLTELFQSYFTGDGKVIMIVNVNPAGTGFEENSNVMRFSAMAKEVGIQIPPGEASLRERLSNASHSANMANCEESEEDEEEDEDRDEFVDMLLAENERLRLRCERAENMCRIIEKNVRDEMGQQLAKALRDMQQYYERQVQAEIDASDAFTDRKIDLFARLSHAVHKGVDKSGTSESDSSSVTQFEPGTLSPAVDVLSDSREHDANIPESPVTTASKRSSLPMRESISMNESQDLFVPHTPSPTKRFRKLVQKPTVCMDDMEAIAHDASLPPSNSRRALR